jgi:hypothetical protein
MAKRRERHRRRAKIETVANAKSEANTPTLKASALDLAVMLYHIHLGAADSEIGYLDPLLPIEYLEGSFNVEFRLALGRMERSLFMANMANEQGKFWHPKGLSFAEWAKSMTPKGYDFDARYNFFKEKGNL